MPRIYQGIMFKIGVDYNEKTLKAAHNFARSVMDSECNPSNTGKEREMRSRFYVFQAAYMNQFNVTPCSKVMSYWHDYHSAQDDIPW